MEDQSKTLQETTLHTPGSGKVYELDAILVTSGRIPGVVYMDIAQKGGNMWALRFGARADAVAFCDALFQALYPAGSSDSRMGPVLHGETFECAYLGCNKGQRPIAEAHAYNRGDTSQRLLTCAAHCPDPACAEPRRAQEGG